MQLQQRLHSRLRVSLLHDALAHEDGAAAGCNGAGGIDFLESHTPSSSSTVSWSLTSSLLCLAGLCQPPRREAHPIARTPRARV